MTASIYNIDVEVGASFNFEFTVKDRDGVVVDYANYVARMQVRDNNDKVQLTPVCSINNGIIKAASSHSDTQKIKTKKELMSFKNGILAQPMRYDVELFNEETKDVIRIIQGIAYIYPRVTQ